MVMLINKRNNNRISYDLLTVTWKLFESDKKLRNFGTDTILYEAEIHMIMYIKDNPDLHVSGLAKKIGVTKGAVSQIVTKLVKKGMVVKTKDEANLSRTLLRLTGKGEVAYKVHEKMHNEFDLGVEEILTDATVEQLEFLHDFLRKLENYIDEN